PLASPIQLKTGKVSASRTPVRRLHIALDHRVLGNVRMHDDNGGDDGDAQRSHDGDSQQRPAHGLVELPVQLLAYAGRSLTGDQWLGDRLRSRPLNHRKLGEGSHRAGSHITNADQPAPTSTPHTTSLGQWSPAQTLAMQVRRTTIIAATHRAGR